jgi:hypothetical protein
MSVGSRVRRVVLRFVRILFVLAAALGPGPPPPPPPEPPRIEQLDRDGESPGRTGDRV